ncbi:RNA-binding S4 domain-containing protein [Peptoniphilus sp. GNH]|nr:S4 domain protein [Clostridiales bacterium KA00134]UHR03327.1 RNA-binding S4 domain-containing protein [Peptoniphilus sp. GNH]
MRLDKFLKNSRIIKRRTLAKQACDGGRVKINDKLAKAGDELKIGDIIEIAFGNGTFKCQVLDLKDIVGKSGAEDLYKVIE